MYVCIYNTHRFKIIKNTPKSPNILKKTYLKTIRTYRKNEILEAPDTRCKLPADVKPSPFTWTFISPEAEEL